MSFDPLSGIRNSNCEISAHAVFRFYSFRLRNTRENVRKLTYKKRDLSQAYLRFVTLRKVTSGFALYRFQAFSRHLSRASVEGNTRPLTFLNYLGLILSLIVSR